MQFVHPEEIVFVGDCDTILNIEMHRAGHFLATAFRNIQIALLQVPFAVSTRELTICAGLNGEFPSKLDQLYTLALLAESEVSFLLPATLRLQELIRAKAIDALPPKEAIKQRRRVCQMAAWAKLAKESESILTQFLQTAWKATGFGKREFEAVIEDELRSIGGSGAQALHEDVDELLEYFNSIKPWPSLHI